MRLFLHYVWKLHNLSTYVVLDRELQFIVLFIKKTLLSAWSQNCFFYSLALPNKWTNKESKAGIISPNIHQ